MATSILLKPVDLKKIRSVISAATIHSALQETDSDLGNKILYDLCKHYFLHDRPDVILAKTKLIGKTYSVALDRRRIKNHISSDFYEKQIVPAFLRSKLDRHLIKWRRERKMKPKGIPELLRLHGYLTKMINPLTDQNKRSFSSKYLHFHLPGLFFMYDSRAVSALRLFNIRIPSSFPLPAGKSIDPVYVRFFYKCVALRDAIEQLYDVALIPRQLDNLLLTIANKQLKTKLKRSVI